MNTKKEQFPATNPNPVLRVEKDGTILYSNEAGEPLLQEWDVRVGEKLPSTVGDLVQRVISHNSPEKTEIKVGNRLFLVVFSPLPEQECVNISGFDISDQKNLEERIQESEEKYRAIFENSIDAILLTTPDGTIQEANLAACQMFMMSEEEIIQAGRDGLTDASDPRLKSFLEKRARIGKSRGEHNHRRKDGTIFPGEVSSGFFKDKNGIIRTAMIIRDISERKLAEEALREREEKFRSAFDDSAVAMALVCPDARLLKVNDAFCQLLGFEKSEMEGRTFLDFTYPDDMEPSILTHKAVINREKPLFWLEKRYIRKDGRVIWCEVSSSPVFNSKGCPIYTVAHIQDITERKRAEEALKKAHDNLEEKVKERTTELEKTYKSLIESEKGLAEAQKMAHIGNWEWDIATDKAYWSNELYRIFGRDPQKLAPTINEFHNYIHPDDRHDYVNLANKALNEKSSLCADIRIISDDGEERRAHIQSEIIFDEKNIPIRIKGIVQDITESKKAEEKIHHLANVVESSSDAIGTLSLKGITTSWNKGAEQIYRYPAEEILGRHISLPAPSHLKNETQKYVELIKQTGTSYRYTTSRLRKDGEMIEVSITLSPVFDGLGKLTAISFISRDITEQKRSEEKLRQSEEKYRNIVETANEGILIINNDNIITYVNKRLIDILGFTEEEVLGRPIWGFISEEYKPIIKLDLDRRRQGISDSYELKLIHKNGSPVWTFLNAKPLFDMEGKYIGAMSMLTDITTRKEAEQALAEIEIARKKEIHHRIKNNLQVISSLLDLQAEQFRNKECIGDSEVLEAFRESQDRVISMALIHEELYKGGEIDTLDFSSYIEELAENLFLTYRIGNRDICLNMNLEENLFLDMDASVPLGIIVNELVSNSLKHAFPGRDKGEIRIKLHRDENGERNEESKSEDCSNVYVLSISDNGIGIPKNLDIENLESLGLQLVTSLVDQLDGELELKRDNGTEFTIRFTVIEKSNQAYSPALQLVDK